MREALQRGKLGISALSPRVTTGKEQWQEWHHDFFHNQMRDFIQDDIDLHEKADDMNTDLEVITLREEKQTALEVCSTFSRTDHKCSSCEACKLFNHRASLQMCIYLTPGCEQAWQSPGAMSADAVVEALDRNMYRWF